MAAPPPPKGKAPVLKPNKPALQPKDTGSLSEMLAKKELTKVETTVTALKLKVTNVLLITKFWGCFEWLTTENMKLVLITSKEANDARLQFISDPSNKRALECKEAFVEVAVPIDYASNEVEVLAYELHQKHRFTHVICHTENDLVRTARIRQMLGITTGQSLQNALRYRDKVLMKDLCVAAGIKCPIYAPVEGAADILQFVSQHGYPVVVKPRLGYSSVDTCVLRNYEEAVTFCKTALKQPGIDPIYGLEIEKFVNGPMYHVDGMYMDGRVILSWPSKYKGTVMQFKTNPYIAGYSLKRGDPTVDRLNSFFVDVIAALGSPPHGNPPCFPFHAEAWITPEDDIVLCEIASRGGGGHIKKEVTELFGINMDEIWTQHSLEDAMPTWFEEAREQHVSWRDWNPKVEYMVGWSYIYPKAGTVTAFPQYDANNKCWVPPLPDYCLHLATWLTEGQSFSGPVDCADTCCAALVKGDTEEQVLQHLDEMCAWFFQHSKWE